MKPDHNNAGGYDLTKVKINVIEGIKNLKTKEVDAEQLKKEIAEKDAEIKQNKKKHISMVLQLKKIGRNFRDKAEAAEKTLHDI